jgi:hypothetical protein
LDLFTTRDLEVERMAAERGIKNVESRMLSFETLFKKSDFAETMKEMLNILEAAYDHPVDIEYTVNFMDDGSYRVNLVQCRPFQVKKYESTVAASDQIEASQIIVNTKGPIIGNSIVAPVDCLIYVVPSEYGQLPVNERYAVARLIGKLTHSHSKQEPTIMLVGPGRWGTTTPSLGVPVKFAEINTVSALCEVVAMREDLVPDVSLGTHFFNDLVEMDMLYLALFPGKKGSVLNEEFILSQPNQLTDILPGEDRWNDTVKVLDYTRLDQSTPIHLYVNAIEQKATCYLK